MCASLGMSGVGPRLCLGVWEWPMAPPHSGPWVLALAYAMRDVGCLRSVGAWSGSGLGLKSTKGGLGSEIDKGWSGSKIDKGCLWSSPGYEFGSGSGSDTDKGWWFGAGVWFWGLRRWGSSGGFA